MTHHSSPETAVSLREGLEAAIRAASLALFVIRKQGVMPNSSWESGFESAMQTARDALNAHAQCAPVAWQWRACIGGQWGSWLILERPVEKFRQSQSFNLDNGTYELRPLYALTSTDDGGA